MTWHVRSLILFLVLATAEAAAAESASLRPASAEDAPREGLVLGVALGGAFSSPSLCRCGSEFGFDLKAGWSVRQRFAVALKASAVIEDGSLAVVFPSDRSGTHNFLGVAVQYWPARRLWLEAGAGRGSVRRDGYPRDDEKSGLSGLIGLGYEAVRLKDGAFTLDVQAAVFATRGPFDDGPASRGAQSTVLVAFGANWHR